MPGTPGLVERDSQKQLGEQPPAPGFSDWVSEQDGPRGGGVVVGPTVVVVVVSTVVVEVVVEVMGTVDVAVTKLVTVGVTVLEKMSALEQTLYLERWSPLACRLTQ